MRFEPNLSKYANMHIHKKKLYLSSRGACGVVASWLGYFFFILLFSSFFYFFNFLKNYFVRADYGVTRLPPLKIFFLVLVSTQVTRN